MVKHEMKSKITISDHAVLRYLERKYKLDIKAIRDEMLTPERISAIKSGATSIRMDGIDFVIKNNTVITALKRVRKCRKI